LLSFRVVSLPREILPESYYMITRRCVQRQFLLRPDPEIVNAFLYCLIVSSIQFEIVLIHSTGMSNHHHTVIYDPHGRVCEFMAGFHKLLAKCVNHVRGRWENCWSSEPACAVRLLDADDVINKVVYAATNPVKDNLVDTVAEWPGVNTVAALFSGSEISAKRPRFFRDKGPMPSVVSMSLELPARLGDANAIVETIRARISRFEERKAAVRLLTGRRSLGRKKILAQRWDATPFSDSTRRELRPRLAACSKWRRVEALRRTKEFIAEYRKARRALLEGNPIPFPPGTYWLRRFAGVQIAS
jgi:putative transposase